MSTVIKLIISLILAVVLFWVLLLSMPFLLMIFAALAAIAGSGG